MSAKEQQQDEEITQKLIGYVNVDSGQIIISDPCRLAEFSGGDAHSIASPKKRKKDFEFSFAGCCNASLSEKQAGQLVLKSTVEGKTVKEEIGVAARTRCGDWAYPVVAFYRGGAISAVLIDFDVFEEFEKAAKAQRNIEER